MTTLARLLPTTALFLGTTIAPAGADEAQNTAIEAQLKAAKAGERAQVLGRLMAPQVTYFHNYGLPQDGTPIARDDMIKMQGGGGPAPTGFRTVDEEVHVSDGAILLTWRMLAEGRPLSTRVAQVWKRNAQGEIVSGTVYYDPAQMKALTQSGN